MKYRRCREFFEVDGRSNDTGSDEQPRNDRDGERTFVHELKRSAKSAHSYCKKKSESDNGHMVVTMTRVGPVFPMP